MMADIPSPDQRRRNILHWLQESQSLTIEELVSRLGVSVMTVHRDLDQLVKEGIARKTYGRVALVRPAQENPSAAPLCAMCHTPVSFRTAFTLHLENGKQIQACCPHCGLMLLSMTGQVASALTRDFLYHRMVNVMKAAYVVESRVHLCCVPSTLCFASLEDAQDFVLGFGGMVMDFEQATAYLTDQHHHAKMR